MSVNIITSILLGEWVPSPNLCTHLLWGCAGSNPYRVDHAHCNQDHGPRIYSAAKFCTRTYVCLYALFRGSLELTGDGQSSLESGVLSVAYVLLASIRGVVPFSDGLVQVVVCNLERFWTSVLFMYSLLSFYQGIAPTLVIVQIGLGREMQDLDTTLRSVSVDFDRNSLITPFAEELREAEVSWQQDNSSIEITGGNLRPRKDEGPR